MLALLAVGALIAVGCSSGNNKSSGSAGTSAPGGSTAATIQDFAFHPAAINAKAGQKVTWSNKDSTTHTVTADDGSFKSGNLNSGASFSFTFAKSGTFKYHCSIHPFMQGTVTVS